MILSTTGLVEEAEYMYSNQLFVCFQRVHILNIQIMWFGKICLLIMCINKYNSNANIYTHRFILSGINIIKIVCKNANIFN
jgi:hypothetical protein